MLKWSVGSGSAIQQIIGGTTMLIGAFAASWITLGATIVLVIFFAIMTAWGFARLVPAIDRLHADLRQTLVP